MGFRANFVVYQRDAQYRGFRCCDILAAQPLAWSGFPKLFTTLPSPFPKDYLQFLENTVVDDVVVVPLHGQRHNDRVFVVVQPVPAVLAAEGRHQ